MKPLSGIYDAMKHTGPAGYKSAIPVFFNVKEGEVFMDMKQNKRRVFFREKFFSLIELLVVIAILGVLVTLVLPGFSGAGEDAKEKVAMAEMKEIQTAFRRFSADTVLESSITKLSDICCYGLWPLLQEAHPLSTSTVAYADYDSETCVGRRGPYIGMEGTIKMSETTTPGGQATVSEGALTVPVVRDPYGGYYRVVCPSIATEDTDAVKLKKYKKLALVCTGPDKTLDTTSSTLYDTNYDFVLDDNGAIKASNDDKVIRLLPTASW